MSAPSPGSAQAGAAAPPVPARISLSVGSGVLLQPLNSSMIAVALVTIGAELGITSGLSWLISGLYLATAVAAPTAGRLADLYGPRKVFAAGLVLVAVGGALGPLLPTLPGLIAARVVLGLGTATQFPAAMAIIRARAARQHEDPRRSLAVLGICAQVSVAFGPTLGGLLVTGFGWRSIFAVNVVLALASGVWVWRATDPTPPERTEDQAPESTWARVDPPGLVLFAATLTLLMLFLVSLAATPTWGWAVGAVPAAALLVWRERRAVHPFLDLRMLASRPAVLVVFARQLLVSTAFYMVFYVLPQWLEGVRHYDPEQAGLLVVPIAGVGVVSTILASSMIRRRRQGTTLLVGNLGLVLAGVLLALALDAGTPWALILLVAAVLGVPNGFNNMANQTELYDAAGPDIGTASGLLRTTQYVGANFSAALLEALLHGPVTDAGLHRVGWGIAAVSVLLVVVTGAGRLAGRRTGSTAIAG